MNYFTAQNGSWDISKIKEFLNPEGMQLLLAHHPLMPEARNDNGDFSTASAYQLINKDHQVYNPGCWKELRKWRGLERIRFSLWQSMSNGLLTNTERHKRGLGTPFCSICQVQMENTLHVLRDCNWAKLIWGNLVHTKHRANFFMWYINEWFYNYLTSQLGSVNDLDWPVVWGVTIWFL